jgi:parallel beta-helix repeat protein
MIKRTLCNLIFLFCLSGGYSSATSYYVRSNGGTGTGLDDANAWSLAKLNATRLSAGDRVYFKRGDVFYGSYTCNSAGKPDNPIVFDAYGSGNNPVISGLKKLESWTQVSGGIYSAALDVPTLNLVTLDGVIKPMGRFPDQGYLPYTSHQEKASISGESIGKLPFDPKGGELVIRKVRWILDRHPIASRSQNTLQYLLDDHYGQNSQYMPVDGNGYFIQNHLATLNLEGEWYYDKAGKRLYVHFGSGKPAERSVKASTVQQNLYLNYWVNLSFNHIDFEGGNVYGAYLIGTSNITFNDCHWRSQGGDGIWGSYIANLVISNSTVTGSLNNGIYIEQNGNNVLIEHVKVTDSGLIAGAAKSGDGAQEGIFVVGNNLKITNCSVLNSGYIGINFQGNNVLVERNLVDTFSNVKDDGAGIYTYNPGSPCSNRIVRKNIVLNAVGAFAGAEGHFWEPFGKAAGIYIDDRSDNTLVDQNTVAHGNWGGIFLHNTGNIQITDNLVYDFGQQLLFGLESATNINFLVNGNAFIARQPTQKSLQISAGVDYDIRSMGKFENNIYARPIDDNQTFTVDRTNLAGAGVNDFSLETWKSEFGHDLNSSKSRVLADSDSKLRFEYNHSGQEKIVTLNASYYGVNATKKAETVNIPPYSGTVLVKIMNSELVESLSSGSWTQPQVWSGRYVPAAGDKVRINPGHTIEVDQDISRTQTEVRAGAELRFSGDYKAEKPD